MGCQWPNGLDSSYLYRGMSHSTRVGALGHLEINSLVRSSDRCGICGMDLCDSACNSNLNQYNIRYE